MNTTEIEAKVCEFFNKELNEANDVINVRKPNWAKPKEVVENAVVRCLGVAFFAQSLGCSYEVIDKAYTDVKKDLEKMLDK